jgi:cysteinyl-tRNA synthetase
VSDERVREHQDRFVEALCDDLDLPGALRTLHDMLGDIDVEPRTRRALAASWDAVLGLELSPEAGLEPELAALVAERDEARSAKDFARADALRQRLQASGIDLIDTPGGTRWVRT